MNIYKYTCEERERERERERTYERCESWMGRGYVCGRHNPRPGEVVREHIGNGDLLMLINIVEKSCSFTPMGLQVCMKKKIKGRIESFSNFHLASKSYSSPALFQR